MRSLIQRCPSVSKCFQPAVLETSVLGKHFEAIACVTGEIAAKPWDPRMMEFLHESFLGSAYFFWGVLTFYNEDSCFEVNVGVPRAGKPPHVPEQKIVNCTTQALQAKLLNKEKEALAVQKELSVQLRRDSCLV